MSDKPTIRLDIKGLQKIIVATVDEKSPELLAYIEEITMREIECFDFETVIQSHIEHAFKDKVTRFFLYGKGRDLLEAEFMKLFSEGKGDNKASDSN